MRLLFSFLVLLLSCSLWAQSPSPDVPGGFRVQIGTNNLPDGPSTMDLGIWGSKSFNAYYLFSLPFGDSGWSFNPGFGIGTDKFSFDNDVTLQRNIEGTVSVVDLDVTEFGEINKTKLATTFLEIPFELRFHVNKDDFQRSVKIFVGGKFGMLLSSHTKVNFELNGENNKLKTKDNFELNRFRYGIQGGVGIAGIAIYYYYGLNDLFESGRGPTDSNHTQVGIAFNLF